jgi:hypothetical protein
MTNIQTSVALDGNPEPDTIETIETKLLLKFLNLI